MKNLRKLPLLFVSALGIALFSCDSEDPVPENDGELITDVVLNFQELDGTTPVGDVFSFTASDSEGIEVGGTPTIETVTLTKGKTYQMTIEVLNSISGEDITEEIFEEADEHQFFFLGGAFTSNILNISYADADDLILGLTTNLRVSSSPGTNNTSMQVLLRHALNKSFPGATNPNFSNYVQAGGETDLDITFPIVIANP